MNWPMIVLGIWLLIMGRLLYNAFRIDEEYSRRMKVKRHFAALRDAKIKPEDYHLYSDLLEK